MPNGKEPPENLLMARRALEELHQVEIFQDWSKSDASEDWYLLCRLNIELIPNGLIPISTEWYVLVNPRYPFREISFFPAKKNGIKQTFQHQHYNAEGDKNVPWRKGKICLDFYDSSFGHLSEYQEPKTSHDRLRWHFERAIRWLTKASRNELVTAGDPFELPEFPNSNMSLACSFSEGESTFLQWRLLFNKSGLIELLFFKGRFVTKRFLSATKEELVKISWGENLEKLPAEKALGIWILLREVPILPPWEAPITWGQLQDICSRQGVNLFDLLEPVAASIRDGKRHIALIGFPIPKRIGEASSQIHWQPLLLPSLSFEQKTAKGFRTNRQGYGQRDRTVVFNPRAGIEWIKSENWHQGEISTRGKVSERLSSKKVLLIGAGALGSVIGELLVREGVHDIVIMDNDLLQTGNLVRHTLTLNDLGESKARAVSSRLNLLSPHSYTKPLSYAFPPESNEDIELIQQCEIVIDCTANDDVLTLLETFPWRGPKLFFSISAGFLAQRLFVFVAKEKKFPKIIYFQMINPWLAKEREEGKGQQWPMEGIGCWHPIFPARIDDIWMLASMAVKGIEEYSIHVPTKPDLITFEQWNENGRFNGVNKYQAT